MYAADDDDNGTAQAHGTAQARRWTPSMPAIEAVTLPFWLVAAEANNT